MSEENYWQAVMARDARSDGKFVYGVRSTGIYCRPSCPSRRPQRQQVVFFEVPEAAERAGFRACLRCRPLDNGVDKSQREIVERACRYIEASLLESQEVTLAALGAHVGMSPHHLQKLFKRVMSITPRQYAEVCRVNRLRDRLRKGDTVTTALYDAGYGSSSRLYEQAPARLGMTPATYRRGGSGMDIKYTIASSPLGRVLVASTEKGVCAVTLGDSDVELEAALRKEYPAANIEKDDASLGQPVSMILEHLEGRRPDLDLPLDVQATAFQQRVWQELQAIPYGSTRSYGDVARAIGKPEAVRAVAQACASNRAALVVPCHRVVRENGELGGYRWGVERKKSLLAHEQSDAEALVAAGDKG
jgi:AraC family transcriptional regulator of adaptative response/methylated-DNA-[protein]-cysteine methyltransferase